MSREIEFIPIGTTQTTRYEFYKRMSHQLKKIIQVSIPAVFILGIIVGVFIGINI